MILNRAVLLHRDVNREHFGVRLSCNSVYVMFRGLRTCVYHNSKWFIKLQDFNRPLFSEVCLVAHFSTCSHKEIFCFISWAIRVKHLHLCRVWCIQARTRSFTYTYISIFKTLKKIHILQRTPWKGSFRGGPYVKKIPKNKNKNLAKTQEKSLQIYNHKIYKIL